MAERSLLIPPNSTQLEIDLAHAIIEYFKEDIDSIKTLRDFRFGNIPPSLLTAVINDMGLGELTRYIPDLRQIIIDGNIWNLFRGTPFAFDKSNSWLFRRDTLRENIVGVHYTNIWIKLEEPVNERQKLVDVANLARLSFPVGKSLTRIHRGRVTPMMTLCSSARLCGALLNNNGGVWDEELKLWLSLNEGDSLLFEDFYDPEILTSSSLFANTVIRVHDTQVPMLNAIPIPVGEVYVAASISIGSLLEEEFMDVSDLLDVSMVDDMLELGQQFLVEGGTYS